MAAIDGLAGLCGTGNRAGIVAVAQGEEEAIIAQTISHFRRAVNMRQSARRVSTGIPVRS